MQRNKYRKKSGRQSRCWLVKPWPEMLPRRLNLVVLQQLHRETEETEKEKREHECICILLSPYIVYTDIWYIHPQALIHHHIVYTIYALHIFVSMCLDLYRVCVCVYIYVCMCISHACICHYPHSTYLCVLSHNTPLDRAHLKPYHHSLG